MGEVLREFQTSLKQINIARPTREISFQDGHFSKHTSSQANIDRFISAENVRVVKSMGSKHINYCKRK